MKPKLVIAVILGGMTGVAHQRRLRLRPALSGLARLDHRRLGGRAAGCPGRCHPRRSLLGRCLVPGRGLPPQARPQRGRRRPGRRHLRHGGQQGQGVRRSPARSSARRRRPGPDPLDRLRLRRRHGLLGDGRLGAAQEDPGGRLQRRHGRQPGDLQPHRHLRPRGHPPGPDRPGPAEDRLGDPRLGGQLHGQSALRRDRRAGARVQRRRVRPPLRGTDAGGDRRRPGRCSTRSRSSSTPLRRAATRPSPEPASCWSRPARSTRRTSMRCTPARPRSRPTWATCSRSRTAPTTPSRRSVVRRSRSSATPTASSGRASR